MTCGPGDRGEGGDVVTDWVDVIDAVALALAQDSSSAEPGDPREQPMLTTVTGASSPRLRQRIESLHAAGPGSDSLIEPLIHQNEVPLYLLSANIVGIAAAAAASGAESLGGFGCDDPSLRSAVAGIVAISALSTLRLDVLHPAEVVASVRHRVREFRSPQWTGALGLLATRTAELYGLLATTNERRQAWRQVDARDRILAEAIAAAVVAGTADESGVPPEHWLFPFHLFCKLAVSAAQDALTTIESWLGITFSPLPRTPERAADLAVFVTDEARSLRHGCRCKSGIDPLTVAYVPRGQCRQADHDLRSWQPGKPKPGSHGGRYATTLWGWLRRWLGGADISRATGDGKQNGRPRPRPNDVAGSVLARRWLQVSHSNEGPVLLYDRILPEFCVNCGRKVQVATTSSATGPVRVERLGCCDHPQRIYRSEFGQRAGQRVARPKLGIIVTSHEGSAGYQSTEALGPLWLCDESGHYFLGPGHCPSCGANPADGHHDSVRHGWVLLPLADAWEALKRTAWQPGAAADLLEAPMISAEDLQFLDQVISSLQLGPPGQLRSPADVWLIAREWSDSEIDEFREAAGERGLELLLRCKQANQGNGRGNRT
jgi:hypothetical protein